MARSTEADSISLTELKSELKSGNKVEEEEYEYKQVRWLDFVTKPKYIPWWILAIVIGVLVALMTLHHEEIVNALKPISEKIRGQTWGFIIPVIVLIIISFPPLFGHEIVGILVGVVYGLWIGFAIVAAGTFLGEVGTWYAFKYTLRKKAVKLEKTNLTYGALAVLSREGGFWIILLIRFSVIPSHLSTAVFSTCDVKFWHFAIATFLTLPKQLLVVYVGVIFTAETKDNRINILVFGITTIVTLAAAVYIYIRMRNIKKALLEQQRQRRLEKQARENEVPAGFV
ncbi:snare associated Golgi protein-domain-containing protein [Halenospora varia]|nr:snare associated Golgi protein-domain-containing protein [Halenospora varia]